ncbi:bactofilin family protein [Vibrio sp. TRT 17S01]|uniref:bactofilin family protein n=1 Tax=Vibrio sp. TRT 17S01 TaxID=3418505 RepID=UPI003CEDD994
MGIFSKQSRIKSQQSATTLIAQGCHVSGQLKLESDIQIDGLVDGQVHVNNSLLISESGTVKGDIFATRVVINGIFDGNCHADKIEILAKGQVTGTLYTDDLSIDQGGKFNGVTQPAKAKQVVDIKRSAAETKPEQPTSEKKKTATS